MFPKQRFSVVSSKAISLALKNKYLLDVQEMGDIEDNPDNEIPDILGDIFFGEVAEFVQLQGIDIIISLEEACRYALQKLLHMFQNFSNYEFEYSELYTMFELCGKDLESWASSNIPFEYPWGKFGIHEGELSVLRLEYSKCNLQRLDKANVVKRWGKPCS